MAMITSLTFQEWDRMSMIDLLIKAGLDRYHLNIFGEWAFGEDFKNLKTYEIPDRWNKLHGDKLVLARTGEMSIDTRKMVKVWQELNDITKT